MKSTVSLPVRLWRICRLVVHLFRGLVLVSGRYGRLNRAGRAHAARDWGHRLLSILGARVRVEGEPPENDLRQQLFRGQPRFLAGYFRTQRTLSE